MLKHCFLFFFILAYIPLQGQPISEKKSETKNDSVKKKKFIRQLRDKYITTKYLDLDLHYIAKYNKYEGVRSSIGGITTPNFSKKYHLKGYAAYGFNDKKFKYNASFSFRLVKKTNTWLNLSYTDDLQETGSTKFLTDKRFFQLSQPRLLNIDLFHEHVTKAITIEHQFSSKLFTETEFALSTITPTYNYGYTLEGITANLFKIGTTKIALQWNPFSVFKPSKEEDFKKSKKGFPKFTLQYTKSYKNIFKSDFEFSKIDFRTIHEITAKNKGVYEFTLISGITYGNTPLTHLYHTYPNNFNRDNVLKRFSVAGLNSFETMYFNEFFSDKYATFQLKYYLKPFNISARYNPQLVLISRYAIGDIKNLERHENVNFGSLKKGYTESGFEINKLLFGFGLSFAYRYGAYHLPKIENNVSFKLTFNVTL